MKRFSLLDIPEEPWKNGCGRTRVICSQESSAGSQTFGWRISVAEIAEDGPFSVFPNTERIAVVLENGPLRLSASSSLGQVVQMQLVAERHVPISFDGAMQLYGHIGETPVHCLNVMTQRALYRATVCPIWSDVILPMRDDTNAILLAAGDGWSINDAVVRKNEGFISENASSIRLTASCPTPSPMILITIEHV